MRHCLITHKTDLDGAACAYVFQYVFPDAAIIYADYKNVDDVLQFALDAPDVDEVWMADIAPSAIQLGDLQPHERAKLRIFDHHEQSAWADERWSEGADGIKGNFDPDMTGSMLLATELQEHIPNATMGKVFDDHSRLLHLAHVRDFWLTEDRHWPQADRFTAVLKELGIETFVEMYKTQEALFIDHLGNIFVSNRKRCIDAAVQRAVLRVDRNGHAYMFTTTANHWSEVGHALLERVGDVEYACVLRPVEGIVELRARKGGYDVAKLAREHGGGGHPTAAGYGATMPWEMLP